MENGQWKMNSAWDLWSTNHSPFSTLHSLNNKLSKEDTIYMLTKSTAESVLREALRTGGDFAERI